MESLANRVLPKFFRDKLERILNVHNVYAHKTAGVERGSAGQKRKHSSLTTQRYRREKLLQAFAQLWELGYQLRSPESLGARHVDALVKHWRDCQLSVATLQTRIAILNVFCLVYTSRCV